MAATVERDMEKLPINRSQKIQLVSIVIPVFNERKMIETKIGRVQNVEIPKELIIMDDGSTDGTREWLLNRFGQGSTDEEKSQKEFGESRADCSRVRVLTHQHNLRERRSPENGISACQKKHRNCAGRRFGI